MHLCNLYYLKWIFSSLTTKHYNAVNRVIMALFNALFPFIFIPYGKIKNLNKWWNLYLSLHDSPHLSSWPASLPSFSSNNCDWCPVQDRLMSCLCIHHSHQLQFVTLDLFLTSDIIFTTPTLKEATSSFEMSV